jgi:2-dehydro-3-deoxyphosphogluconate aldolase / (4S)-4-hydroxy-2-oxoglutarate aldolase
MRACPNHAVYAVDLALSCALPTVRTCDFRISSDQNRIRGYDRDDSCLRFQENRQAEPKKERSNESRDSHRSSDYYASPLEVLRKSYKLLSPEDEIDSPLDIMAERRAIAWNRSMKKQDVQARIYEIGIVPAIRTFSQKNARFAADTIHNAGIPIAEITVTVPGALELISELRRDNPDMIVGAGTVLDTETAQRCLDAGAQFLTSPGLVLEVVEFARKKAVVVFPGALTPTEIIAAWKAGADLVKVFPCAQVGGDSYIRALKAPFPDVPFIASGGVNQQTAFNFIMAGSAALGIGGELIPRESVELRQVQRIRELARRFIGLVKDARIRRSSNHPTRQTA